MLTNPQLFDKYFTVNEAHNLIPFVQATFETAFKELAQLKDDVILYKRMHHIYESQGTDQDDPGFFNVATLLHRKWHDYEDAFHHWISTLTDRGIQVRDFKRGLIDFPYQDQAGNSYFLCWHVGENELCYFHDIFEGFKGRKPLAELPD